MNKKTTEKNHRKKMIAESKWIIDSFLLPLFQTLLNTN